MINNRTIATVIVLWHDQNLVCIQFSIAEKSTEWLNSIKTNGKITNKCIHMHFTKHNYILKNPNVNRVYGSSSYILIRRVYQRDKLIRQNISQWFAVSKAVKDLLWLLVNIIGWCHVIIMYYRVSCLSQ